MTAVGRLREAINETQGRWESAATSMETCITLSQSAVSQRLEAQKRNAVRMAARLGNVLRDARELAPEAREAIAGEISRLANQLDLGVVRDRAAALEQKQRIEAAKQDIEERLGRVSDDVHPDLEQAARDWIRAQMELETNLELAAQRFACEQSEDQAWFESRKQEMLRSIEQFRIMLGEKSMSATRRGRPFGPEMDAAYDRIRTSFCCLAEPSSAYE